MSDRLARTVSSAGIWILRSSCPVRRSSHSVSAPWNQPRRIDELIFPVLSDGCSATESFRKCDPQVLDPTSGKQLHDDFLGLFGAVGSLHHDLAVAKEAAVCRTDIQGHDPEAVTVVLHEQISLCEAGDFDSLVEFHDELVAVAREGPQL